MYLLDTNVVSELRKAKTGRANPQVVAWANGHPASHFYLSVISILELETGVLLIERRDAEQGAVLRTWLDQQVLPAFAERIIPIDEAVAIQCARLHVPDSRSERDALIAASALVHQMTVVTGNVNDFEPAGVSVINPWQLLSDRLKPF